MRFRSYRAAFGLALTIAVTAGIAACDTTAGNPEACASSTALGMPSNSDGITSASAA